MAVLEGRLWGQSGMVGQGRGQATTQSAFHLVRGEGDTKAEGGDQERPGGASPPGGHTSRCARMCAHACLCALGRESWPCPASGVHQSC